ncbi:hypothetical protein [Streptomyces caniscabiei]|uniref:Uncharacterized protein n=1 Tax=Streptomyces caniscabiei TaxID=2746961 RepID=A0ABU4MX20_9ACTN|nr:hypothetical protein [Streptomyces caniscabiei]MBE4741324.1 hypothetical protein [Streptomyces caniscabiei]MBE4760975.1 hypothetical protein [Streptomyces caniscabiei]MBE4774868.1 hypothetical protein [Streptomyces caniscabiei]MBE4789626.1 hypothetical protein [Streptomyces caniscabiei]MBE4798809.1 hypothetical protein [Streptomyces caniscabiei]
MADTSAEVFLRTGFHQVPVLLKNTADLGYPALLRMPVTEHALPEPSA